MKKITEFMCKTSDIGVNDYLFGGVLLSHLDEAGAILAYTAGRNKKMVTLKVSELIFKKPVKVKDIVTIYGQVISVGNTSMTIRLVAKSLNVTNNEESTVCETSMVFVRIDDEGNKTPLPKEVIQKYK